MLMVWVILIISLLFGTLLGYVTSTIPRLGFFLAGFWLGTIIAFLVNNVLLFRIKTSNQSVPLWIAILLFGSLCGVSSCVFWRVLVIVATSFVGAYCMIRPFGKHLPLYKVPCSARCSSRGTSSLALPVSRRTTRL